ncbi:DUF5054 domain-containing protein [Gordoniibacillus kamchatkensis]|uniref:DUF5054 domain-containing protein n=1 Tax=Gordoniibacillus kamchatkensis TaxID=1590651 RepID=UPI000696163F|nr:DUF5054 domain-containing protein [Paenibacillus sp. VKM B-2647]
MEPVKRVHVVFKTHLDLGFTDLAEHVANQYFDRFIPMAMELSERLAAEEGDCKFVWTTGSWLIHEYLKRANREQAEKMREAISRGYIAWHGLPFTTHTELMDPELFEFGLSLSKKLDAAFGKSTIAAKMTDVPGHTAAIIPHLARSGIQFLHLGVNPASKVPSVPGLFVWKAKDGSELIVNYADNYGKSLEFEGLRDVLVFAHTGDNSGPPSLEAIKKEFARLAEQYPGASIQASTLDAYAENVIAIKHRLPVVHEEIGDSWIHGIATDPWKVARYRELLRLRKRWLEVGEPWQTEECEQFSNYLLLIAEHTWGLNLQKYLPDYRNYSRSMFDSARQANLIPQEAVPAKYQYLRINPPEVQRSYQFFESSWREQREYVQKAVDALSSSKRSEVLDSFAAMEPEPKPLGSPRQVQVDAMYRLGGFDVRFASDGSISRLIDRNGKEWADESHHLGIFAYETFGIEHYHTWFEQYVSNRNKTYGWSDSDFGKPGMELSDPQPQGRTYSPRLISLEISNEEDHDVVRTQLIMPDDAGDEHGSPKKLSIDYVFYKNGGQIGVEFIWRNKPAYRLPEASWFSFVLKLDNPNLWKMDKMGMLLSPLEVVKNGGRNLHALNKGIFYHGTDGQVEIETLDAPLLSPGERRMLRFDNTFAPLEGGMHFNLHNNVWGTNFPMWFEEDMRFRFMITFHSALRASIPANDCQ